MFTLDQTVWVNSVIASQRTKHYSKQEKFNLKTHALCAIQNLLNYNESIPLFSTTVRSEKEPFLGKWSDVIIFGCDTTL